MKYKHLLPPLVIFATFLLTGIWMGRWIGNSFQADDLRTAGSRLPAIVDMHNPENSGEPAGGLTGEHSNAPLPVIAAPSSDSGEESRPPQKQTNVLLIGVDDLGASQPILQSVWLILYLQDMPQITWMPIYPQILRTQAGVGIQARAALADTFMIEDGLEPAQDFLQLLENEGIWWSHYVILDQAAAIALIDSLGGVEIVSPQRSTDVQKVSGSEAFAEIHTASTDLQGALTSQANLIQQLCRIPPKSYLNMNRALFLFEKLHNHLITDITAEHVIDDLQRMISRGGGFVCDFPSLSLLSSLK